MLTTLVIYRLMSGNLLYQYTDVFSVQVQSQQRVEEGLFSELQAAVKR